MTDATKNALWRADWYLKRQQVEGAQRVIHQLLNFNPEPAESPPAEHLVPVAQEIVFGELLASVAETQIGVREVGNNGGAMVRQYQAATWLKPGAWPWCAAFICYCVQEAAKQSGGVRCKLPRTASARDLYNWAKDIDNDTGKHRKRSGGIHAGVRSIDLRRERMQRGDIIIFDTFSHCGIVRYDETPIQFDGRKDLETIEGNTNKAGAREGDGVYAKRRSARRGGERVRHAIRIVL